MKEKEFIKYMSSDDTITQKVDVLIDSTGLKASVLSFKPKVYNEEIKIGGVLIEKEDKRNADVLYAVDTKIFKAIAAPNTTSKALLYKLKREKILILL